MGGVVSAILPSPSDFLHYWIQDYLRNNMLAPTMFWLWQTIDWYLADTVWWAFLLLLYWSQLLRRRSEIETMYLLGTVISLGAIVGILTGWYY